MATQFVQMTRDSEQYPPPYSADVHPDEVANFARGGWVPAPQPANDDIPADFPGAVSLKESGITQLSQLAGKSDADLLAIKGIKAATAKAILNRLAALSFTDY